jgi:hypothetical protein
MADVAYALIMLKPVISCVRIKVFSLYQSIQALLRFVKEKKEGEGVVTWKA